MSETVNRPPGTPLSFERPVPDGGYRWWYLDAVSEDGLHALVIIAFIGSVFSPYYYRARARGPGVAENHCAMNVALYGPGGRWCMTERRAASVQRAAGCFVVGPSAMGWDGSSLCFELDERAAPFGQALRGRVVARPLTRTGLEVPLDRAGRHRWLPWAPRAEVSVELDAPALRWRGTGYLDGNEGDEPLERAFRDWDWSRTETAEGLHLHYEVRERDGRERLHAYRVDAAGVVCEVAPAPRATGLRRTGWGLRRRPRFDHPVGRVRGLEDTPFYSRTLFEGEGDGRQTVHERLDLDRFRAPWVRLLLPFRMPRELRGGGADR